MKTSLFPEMDREVAEDRLATKRERVQHARARLKNYEKVAAWVMAELLRDGPQVEINLGQKVLELRDSKEPALFREFLDVLTVIVDLWLVGKLWRKEFKNHPSGERCYIYGIRGRHNHE